YGRRAEPARGALRRVGRSAHGDLGRERRLLQQLPRGRRRLHDVAEDRAARGPPTADEHREEELPPLLPARWRSRMRIPSTFLGTILLLTLASGARAATDYCTLTANDALRGCKSDAAGGYWVAVGKCDNIADGGDRRDCKNEASADKADELDLCNEQLAARLDACEHLGPDTYEPAIDPANFVS